MSHSQVAVVTGAGSGIGRETAMLLAEKSYEVVLAGRTREKLEDMQEHIRKRNYPPSTVQVVEFGKAGAAEEFAEAVDRDFGRVDVLVNNAAIAPFLPFEKGTGLLLQDVMAANVIAPYELIRGFWEIFVRQGSGCVVNISSMAAVNPFPGLSLYAASKCALESFTRSIHTEGKQFGIRAFSIAPGAVETPMLRNIFSEGQIPASQTMEAKDIARIILACVQGRMDNSCGTVLHVPDKVAAQGLIR